MVNLKVILMEGLSEIIHLRFRINCLKYEDDLFKMSDKNFSDEELYWRMHCSTTKYVM